MNLLAVGFCLAKYRALAFHTRDFPYYLQFYTKVFDDSLPPRLSLNPQGDNFLQMRGVEGVKSLHQALHFEPMKYVYGALYFLFKSPMTLFVFTSAVFFSPILYMLAVFPVKTDRDRYFVALFSLAYCLYPSVLFAVSYDLRPFTFLAPLFMLSFLSVHFRRPAAEAILFFNLMFFAREEALLLGVVIVLYAVVCSYEERSGRWARVVALAASLGLWASCIIVYYAWTGYETKLGRNLYEFFTDPAGLALLLTVGGTAFYLWKRLRPIIIPNLRVVTYSLVFVPLVFQLISLKSKQVLFHPRWILLAYCILILMVILWQSGDGPRRKAAVLYSLGALAALSLPLNFTTPRSAYAAFGSYVEDAKHASLVWSQREGTDKHHAQILNDFQTYQAFSDYEYVYVYERLPWDVTEHPVRWRRYYPLNVDLLVDLLGKKIEIVVISNEEEVRIQEILDKAGLQGLMEPVFSNKKYSVLRIRR